MDRVFWSMLSVSYVAQSSDFRWRLGDATTNTHRFGCTVSGGHQESNLLFHLVCLLQSSGKVRHRPQLHLVNKKSLYSRIGNSRHELVVQLAAAQREVHCGKGLWKGFKKIVLAHTSSFKRPSSIWSGPS